MRARVHGHPAVHRRPRNLLGEVRHLRDAADVDGELAADCVQRQRQRLHGGEADQTILDQTS
jgi:hypothetical protein